MGLFRSLAGLVVVRITSADLTGMLSQISERNIQLLRVEWIDELSCQATVYQRDSITLGKLARNHGDKLEIINKSGVYWSIKSLMHRPVLVIGVIVFGLLALYMPTRILFVNVEGNTTVPTREILEAADNCGISFFSSRREIRSEKIKNALLEQIPELQWIGVNTAGCVATINVTEKSTADYTKDSEDVVGSIIATRDGVIQQCTVTKGDPVCRVGQAVKAGQVLVSGYTDCGIAIKATKAEAEVYALTLRQLEVVTPTNAAMRASITATETKFSLLIGKKLINLFKDSGISDTSCVKIYEEYWLTLPGGFQLPVGILRQTQTYYSNQSETASQEACSWLNHFAEKYLHTQMIAGQVISRDVTESCEAGICTLEGKYSCREMIGQFKREEFIQR